MKQEWSLTEGNLLALEDQIDVLVGLRAELLRTGSLETNLALEADARLGSDEYAKLRFSGKQRLEKTQIALESMAAKIWEALKGFFRKIVEYIRKAIQWFMDRKQDLSEQQVHDAGVSAKSFADTANDLQASLGQLKRKNIATEDASAGFETRKPAAILDEKIKELNPELDKKLSWPEALVIYSTDYASSVERLADSFARKNPVEQLTSKAEKMERWFETAIARARKIDEVSDDGDRKSAAEAFTKELDQNLDESVNDFWVDHGKDLARDVTDIANLRDSKTNAALHRELPEHINSLTVMIMRLGINFNHIKNVIGRAKSSVQELRKLEVVFTKFIKRIEDLERNLKVDKPHEAQSLVMKRLMTEAHAVIGQIRTIAQGLMLFPQFFNDSLGALVHLQKHVIEIYQKTIAEFSGDYEFSEGAVHSQLAALRTDLNRTLKLRSGL
jgi:hypothetical protein